MPQNYNCFPPFNEADHERKYVELVPFKELRVGCADPDHERKGKPCWIICDDHLKGMYKPYSFKTEILIGCFLPGKL